MSDSPLQSTMREMRRMLTAPRFWIAMTGASILLGMIGPFGTFEGLRLPARLAYWAATVAATYLVGVACVAFLARFFYPGRMPNAGIFALFGAVAGVPVTIVVWLINAAVFEGPGDAIPFLPLLGYTVAIAAVVSAVVAVFSEQYESARQAAAPALDPPPKRPRILERLPPHLRGELSHLTVQDHYVDIRTDRGGTLVLMRLADAIAETEGAPGLRIHRSHWIAISQVAQSVRLGGRLMLKMRDGTMLPVSRSYLEDVRAAGLA